MQATLRKLYSPVGSEVQGLVSNILSASHVASVRRKERTEWSADSDPRPPCASLICFTLLHLLHSKPNHEWIHLSELQRLINAKKKEKKRGREREGALNHLQEQFSTT